MITKKIVPAHILRLYSWEILRTEVGMQQINDIVPLIPIEDEPKVADSGMPYCIYGYAESESGRLEQIHRGVFSLRVISSSWAKMVEITNTLALAYESSDVATEAVNRWAGQYPNGALDGIRFTHIRTAYVEGGEAAEIEGGRMDGVINVSYEYVNHLTIPLPTASRGGLWT